MYWSVARLFEPWGEQWHNYDIFRTISENNKIKWVDPNTGLSDDYEMGNHITIQDPYNYKSNVSIVNIPAGVAPTRVDFANNNYHIGGYLSTVLWNPPNDAWYKDASNIFRSNGGLPVICYLAVIKEPSKPDDGFHTVFEDNSRSYITDFAFYNNNVATVNSFLATPSGLYKNMRADGSFESEIGFILVDNPLNFDTINISILPDSNYSLFSEHGGINIILDETLWENWSLVNFRGTGFSIVDNNIININGAGIATIEGITLPDSILGRLGVQFTYTSHLPDEDFIFSLSVGAYTHHADSQIGSPTHFITNVLAEPAYNNFVNAARKLNITNDIKIFPNPVNDVLNIEFGNNPHKISVTIYDISMKEVFNETLHNQYQINTNNLENGTYILKIDYEDKTKIYKLVK